MFLDLEPDGDALFLDFDGTLVEIAPRPEDVVVPKALPGLLNGLQNRLGGALAVVSGRPIADLDAFLEPARFAASGLHGMESRWVPGGEIERTPPPESLEIVRRELNASGIAERGVRLEDKGLSIAAHYRAVPDEKDAVIELLHDLAAPFADLSVLAGKMVVEVKPSGYSKATAVERVMDHPPFAGRRPVFIGDDVTDEDGMRAAMARGGVGVKVGEGPSVADKRIGGVGNVLEWLERQARGL